MYTKQLSALVAALLIVSTPLAHASGLDGLQKKINESATRAGVPAPDVKTALAGEAKEKEESERNVNPLKNLPKIDRMVTMQANQIRAIQGSDGKVLYLIDNGRFALVGNMVDVWNRKALRTIDDIQDAISHIDLKRMGFNVEKVNHITVGTGGEHVTIFVDPRCGWCHRLLKEIQADESYFKQYTFDIVILKVLGDESGDLATKLACAKETNQMAKFNALVEGRKAINELEQIPQCDKSVIATTDLQKNALGIQSVPLVISPDSRYVRGKPNNLRAFLDPKEAQLAKERAEAEQQIALKKAEEQLAGDNEEKAKRVPLRDK